MSSYRDRVLKELVRDASALIETDRKVVKAVVESDLEKLTALLTDFRDKRIRVKKNLSDLGIVEGVDEDKQEILARIQRKFPTESLIEQMERKSGEDISFFELSDDEAGEIGSDLLYSWISHYEYVRDMFKVNTLILASTIAEGLRKYIREVRCCFAFQQYNAVISLCRTILEAAAKNICENEGYFEPHGEKVVEINPEVSISSFERSPVENSRGVL